jgi:hypothetical protein
VPDPAPLPGPEESEGEVRPLPVLAETQVIQPRREVSLPAAVAAATGGFLLGIVSFVLVKLLRRPRRAVTLRVGSGRKRSQIAASRSFLVDVHLLKDK